MITRSTQNRSSQDDVRDEAEVSLAEGSRKKQKTKKTTITVKTSRFFQVLAPSPVPKPSRPMSNHRYGLIQEEIQDNLFYLLVQSILWNQTWGRSARPVLDTILSLYPTPEKMADAVLSELTLIIQPIGLHNRRAKRLIDLAQIWLAAPPCKERRYRKVGYPAKQSGKDIEVGEVLTEVSYLS
jgi:methyl-CpG-binding domain protein 4